MHKRTMIRKILPATFFLWVFVNAAVAAELPPCLSRSSGTATESVIAARQIQDDELLARLVYAEGISTGFGDDPLVYQAIAWGVMNRVRLGAASPGMQRVYGRGLRGVVFKKGQFNPAVSARSPFAKAFLCPDHTGRWQMARRAAGTAITGKGNPFIRTPWEKQHNLSLVVNFYYPQSVQAKGPAAPWEGSKSLSLIGDLRIEGKALSASRIRFYRLNRPPGDLSKK